jgi:hypothetical protein
MSHNNIRNYFLPTIVGVFALLACFVLFKDYFNKPPLDASRCPAEVLGKLVVVINDGRPQSTTMIDQLNKMGVDLLNKKALPGYLISVFSAAASVSDVKPIFSYCQQRRNADAKGIGSSSNYAVDFEAPFLKALRLASHAKTTKNLPDTLGALANSSYLSHSAQSHLIVLSDLDDTDNQARNPLCADSPASIRENLDEQYLKRPSFKNVQIEFKALPSASLSAKSNQCRNRFWNWFFGDNAGPFASFDVSYLPG